LNIKLPNTGNIKIEDKWIEFTENDLILISEAKYRIFKVTSKDIIPTYDAMMRYGVSLGSSITNTPSGAFYDYTHEHLIDSGYVLNTKTLDLFEVFREASDNNPKQTAKNLKFTEKFLRKLEK